MRTLIRTPDMPDGIRKARLAWVAETLRKLIREVPTRSVGIQTDFLGKVKR